MKDDLDLLLDEVDSSHTHRHEDDDHVADDHLHGHRADDDDEDFFDDSKHLDLGQDHSFDDDDDDLEPLKASHDSLEDEDQEEEAEDEVSQKKGTNPLIIGAACVVGIMGCAGAYLKFAHSDVSEQPMVHTSMPAPSMAELGKDLSVPSTNLVDDEISPAAQEIQISSAASAPAVESKSTQNKILSNVPTDSKSVPVVAMAPGIIPIISASDVKPAPTVSEFSTQSQLNNSEVIAPGISSSNDLLAGGDSLSRSEVQGIVTEALKNSGASDIKKELASINEALRSAKNQDGSVSRDYGVDKDKILKDIAADAQQKNKEKIENLQKLVVDATNGKQRLPGFQVINATRDGTISIIKSPNGRTFALFKGESFKSSNGLVLQVKEIVSEGQLVVVGDGWFIDETMEDVQKTYSKPKTVVVDRPKHEDKQPVKKQIKADSVSGWSLNATFEGGGYLVKSPAGEYRTITKGDTDPVLGKVIGIDDQGNLKTDKGTIEGSR